MTRCTGHCCKAFILPYGPEDLSIRITAGLDGSHPMGRVEDGEQIRDMVIFLGTTDQGWPGANPALDGSLHHYYTCKHHDAESGDCKIYDQRPGMCRRYPYGEPCKIPGCTAADLGVVPVARLVRNPDIPAGPYSIGCQGPNLVTADPGGFEDLGEGTMDLACDDAGCQREAGHPPPHRSRSPGPHNDEIVTEW